MDSWLLLLTQVKINERCKLKQVLFDVRAGNSNLAKILCEKVTMQHTKMKTHTQACDSCKITTTNHFFSNFSDFESTKVILSDYRDFSERAWVGLSYSLDICGRIIIWKVHTASESSDIIGISSKRADFQCNIQDVERDSSKILFHNLKNMKTFYVVAFQIIFWALNAKRGTTTWRTHYHKQSCGSMRGGMRGSMSSAETMCVIRT